MRAPHNRVAHWLEHQVLANANVVIANTPLNQSGWIRVAPDEAPKIVTIPNGSSTPERFERPTLRPIRDRVDDPARGRTVSRTRSAAIPRRAARSCRTWPSRSNSWDARAAPLFDFPSEIRNRGLEIMVRLEGQVSYAEALQRMMRGGTCS